ncbi:endonuclease G, mitochondrial-like [Anthonomus grandis grandis]|uniref:endonuclease G, mitochondrial-like n=1 Tax=Anthonomus grandis grandis TaxID=2921223 RepID=UPI0021667321|nr:endonuclease G, mitochondrial-like [Anthonomus grandis grandis]
MTTRKVRFFVTSTSIATVAFFTGNYYGRQYKLPKDSHQALRFHNVPESHETPIFNHVLTNKFTECKSEDESLLNNIKSFIKDFSINFGTIKAASPIPEPYTDNKVTPYTSNSSRISQIMKHGFPGLDNVISYSDYVLSYDRRNRVAHWVFEHLTEECIKKNDEVDRSKCDFKEDDHIHPYFRSKNSDYKGSGYDRGHLAAAGNHKSCQKHVEETFYLTNMAPQVGKGFNRDSWNRLEKYVRKLTRNYLNVYCCTGPLYLPRRESNGKMYVKYEVIGSNHVAVPTHFFKVVVGETKDGQLDMECFVMENTVIDDSIPVKNFQVPLETIERASGLLFFTNVARNKFRQINGKK